VCCAITDTTVIEVVQSRRSLVSAFTALFPGAAQSPAGGGAETSRKRAFYDSAAAMALCKLLYNVGGSLYTAMRLLTVLDSNGVSCATLEELCQIMHAAAHMHYAANTATPSRETEPTQRSEMPAQPAALA
jgi:hypothetical protein